MLESSHARLVLPTVPLTPLPMVSPWVLLAEMVANRLTVMLCV